jgi:hypothetical protein
MWPVPHAGGVDVFDDSAEQEHLRARAWNVMTAYQEDLMSLDDLRRRDSKP